MKRYILCWLLWPCMMYGQSDQNNNSFERDLQLYEKQLLGNGPSVEAYYNLGNTYLKSDSITQAIYYFEKALKLIPNNETVQNNLVVARNRLYDPLIPAPEFFLFKYWDKFSTSLSPNVWASISVITALLLFSMVYFYMYRNLQIKRRYLSIVIISLSMAIIITWASGYYYKNLITSQREGIIFQDSYLKSGPDNRSEDVKKLYPGYKVTRIDSLQGWLKVRTVDREEGWILPQWQKII